MASTKYVGYVGGVAVAVGVGAAIAAAGQGTAHADTTDGGSAAKDSTSTSAGGAGVNAGPKRGETKTKPDRAKPRSKVNDGVEKVGEKVAAHVTKTASTVSKSITDSLAKPKTKPVAVKPAKPTAEEFEAKQVARLKDLFTPKQAAAPKPDDSALEDKPASKAAPAPAVTTAVQTQADTIEDSPAWNPNPWRPDDPTPTDFPDAIMDLRQALMDASPDQFDPFVREATEQIYRGSQMVPWVNAVIPIGKILPSLAEAIPDTPEARDARQTIINELIKTLPITSFAYYGYDIVADVINMEDPAATLKHEAVATVWDLLDPLELAHNKGESGI
ncbi:hypothetical protein [Mycolicibacterium sp. XJ870]